MNLRGEVPLKDSTVRIEKQLITTTLTLRTNGRHYSKESRDLSTAKKKLRKDGSKLELSRMRLY